MRRARRKALTILAVVTGGLLASGPANAQDDQSTDATAPPAVSAAAESVVSVIDGDRRGAGFALDAADEVVAAADVVAADGNTVVVTVDGRRLEARAIGRDAEAGLVILRVDGLDLRPLDRAEESADRGDAVYAIGSPLGFGGEAIRRLEVTSVGGERAERRVRLDAATAGTSQGGPLVTPEGGVVAVLLADSESRGRGVPVGRVKRVERSNGDGWPWLLLGLPVLGGLGALGLMVLRSRLHRGAPAPQTSVGHSAAGEPADARHTRSEQPTGEQPAVAVTAPARANHPPPAQDPDDFDIVIHSRLGSDR